MGNGDVLAFTDSNGARRAWNHVTGQIEGNEMRPTFAAILRHCAKRDRAWRANSAALIANVARLHPETGGHIGCAHNWGNDEARAAMRRSEDRWSRYSAAMDARYRQLMKADLATMKRS